MDALTIRRIIDECTRSTGEQVAGENPWSQSKPYHSTTVNHRSHPQCSGIKPGPMRWDATSTFTRPRPNPTLTTFTFSATYVNGSTVKCDKRSSTITYIRTEGLKDGNFQTMAWKVWKLVTNWLPVPIISLNTLPIRGNTWYFNVNPPHAVIWRPQLTKGYKNANLAYLKKLLQNLIA